MDVFDLLIILLFVGAPLIEGILRKQRSGEEPGEESGGGDPGDVGMGTGREGGADLPRPAPAPTRTTAGYEEGYGGPEGQDPDGSDAAASDMVPDDLWEVLTGEQRTPASSRPHAPSAEGEGQAWSEDSVAVQDGVGAMADSDWVAAPWEEGLEEEAEGRPAGQSGPKVVSLERPLEDPEVRHRQFHEKMDSRIQATSIGSETGQERRATPLQAALRTRSSLRQAVLLSEVLGRPVSLRPPGGEDQG